MSTLTQVERSTRPPVIDHMLHGRETMALIAGRWYIAKSENDKHGFITRLRHAWLVLIGRANAVQFYEDHHKCFVGK